MRIIIMMFLGGFDGWDRVSGLSFLLVSTLISCGVVWCVCCFVLYLFA